MATTKRLAPVTVIVGADEYVSTLNAREVANTIRASYREAEMVHCDASTMDAYDFQEITGISLLADETIVLMDNLQQADDSLVEAMVAFMQQDQQTNFLVARHEGGVKGRGVLKRLQTAGATIIPIPDLKKDEAKLNFVYHIFERLQRHIQPAAAERLVSVLGNKTGQLAALCQQLCYDYDEDPISLALVDRYLLDDPAISVFFIAYKAIQGQFAQAMAATRTAIQQGSEPIALIGALASKIRMIAQVLAVKQGIATQAQLSMNPWAFKMTMRQTQGWDSHGIANALRALALADEQCKTGQGSDEYALERCIRLIAHHGHDTVCES